MNIKDSKHDAKDLELCSEKARNIIGPIPQILIRYGIIIVFLVLIVLFSVLSFIPYRKVVSGIATVREAPISLNGNVFLNVELKILHGDNNINPESCKIVLKSPDFEIEGIIVKYTALKTVDGLNNASLSFDGKDLKHIEYSEVDFRLTLLETSILKRLLNSIEML